MHRLIMKPTDEQVVDHRNGNGLDNRRDNLRNCTNGQNAQNRTRATGKTGLIGCQKNTWGYMATVTLHGVQYSIARYPTAEEAAVAHDRATLFYKPEFGSINFRDRDSMAASIEQLREEAKNETAGQAVSKGGTSIYNGVCKADGKWRASISLGGKHREKQHSLGAYATEEAAAEAFDAAAKYFAVRREMKSRFALNFINREILPKSPATLRRHCSFVLNNRYSSKYMGVSRAYRGQWQCGIKADYKQQHLAIVKSEEGAARLYDAVARSLGFPAEKLNFPEEEIESMTIEQAKDLYHKFKRRPNGFAIPEISTSAAAD